jgi:hypothetical protein
MPACDPDSSQSLVHPFKLNSNLTSRLLDTPKAPLLHYAVFFHFKILAIVLYKESA